MSRVPGSASLSLDGLVGEPATGVGTFLRERAPRECHLYGYGKAAIRDGLRLVDESRGSRALLPAYIPDGVVEAFRDADLGVEFYGVRSDLRPDLDDVADRIDGETAAVLSVNYFGFPQTGRAALGELAEDHHAVLIDDNAHAPLSCDGDRLLGTDGAFGVTSVRKLLPVPDGAVLFLNDERLARRADRLELAGTAAGPGRREVVALAEAVAARPLRALSGVLDGEDAGGGTRDPREVYERSKVPMSPLSRRVLERTPATALAAARRQNFAAWARRASEWHGVELPFERLPEGVCPQVCPVVTGDTRGLTSALRDAGVGGVHTWPPLPDEVRASGFSNATFLADHLVTLPVHREVTAAAIREATLALDWS